MEKKYIIKLEENEIAYKTVNSNGCPMIGLLHPVPYTEPDMEQIRKEAYEQGLSDANEGKATCQYCEYQYLDDTEEPCKKCRNAYMNKYKPKAKEEQIQVGDEVNAPFGKAIVVNIDSVAEKIWLVYADGHGGFEYFKDAPTKTGRHFPEIAEVLQKIKETE